MPSRRETALSFNTIEEAIEEIREGRIIIVVDDEDRENEGDLTLAAERVSPEAINFMATHGRGLICLSLTGERLDQLNIPMMVEGNSSRFGTAFTVSIEARQGVTTGISAADRAMTIRTAIDPATKPSDLVRPGHVFPLRGRPGGVLERAGQTEASIDLARLAGLLPAGVICEVMHEDGTMARIPQLLRFAEQHRLKMVTVADLIGFRMKTETFVQKVAQADVVTGFGGFRAMVFENTLDHENHLVLIKGEMNPEVPVLVRVHTQSTLGDVFHALTSESGEELRSALRKIESAGSGVLVYFRQERMGVSLADEIRSYTREKNADKVNRPESSGNMRGILRHYGIGAQILRQVGVGKIRLMTNHPKKFVGLQGYGLTVVEEVPLELGAQVRAEEIR